MSEEDCLHLQFISIGIIGSAYFLGTGLALVYLMMLCLGEPAVHITASGSLVSCASEFIYPILAIVAFAILTSFPNGVSSVFLTMSLILVNFQGNKTVGLAAGETKDTERLEFAAVEAVF